LHTWVKALLPFAVIGSEEEVQVKGEPVRARVYPWGIAQVDNPDHSDFGRLRNALLRFYLFWLFTLLLIYFFSTHLADLKALTEDVLYEQYRTEKLSKSINPETEYNDVLSSVHVLNNYFRDQSLLPEDLATQSVRLKEEQLRREEEKLREAELRMQRELNEKRQQLLAKEESLRNLESRLAQGSTY
jgi:cell division control protein 11